MLLRLLLALLTFGVVLAACNGDDVETPDDAATEPEDAADDDPADDPADTDADGDAADTDDAGDLVRLSVADTAGIPVAFVQYGVQEGFYEEEGLDVEVTPVQGAAPIITGIVSGDFDLGGSDVVTFVQALHQGLPLQMVTSGTFAPTGLDDPDADFATVAVAADSHVQSVEDLEGETVAVNVLGNIAELVTRGALAELGVAHDTIELVEVPFPDMPAAVERGDVTAAFLIEPFQTIGLAQGLNGLFPPYTTFREGMQVGSIVAQRQYIEDNPDVIERFQRAHAATARHVAENEDDFRAALPDITELDPELADSVTLPQWQEDIDRETVEIVAERMAEYGIIDSPPDLSEAFAPRP
jgi:NitT/TauT family transport system substrate-binding protein